MTRLPCSFVSVFFIGKVKADGAGRVPFVSPVKRKDESCRPYIRSPRHANMQCIGVEIGIFDK